VKARNVPVSISLKLSDSRANWFSKESPGHGIAVWGRGYAFADGSSYENATLLTEIITRCDRHSSQEQIQAFQATVRILNGCWALIFQAADGTVVAAVDRSRGVPLFYGKHDDGYVLADAPDQISDECGMRNIDLVSAAEFLLSGFVSGRETLYEGVYQVEPGTLVRFIADGSTARHVPQRYFQCFPEDISTLPREELEEELELILDSTFARLASFLKGRTAVLPLSGGYDSRLIAWMLKKHGIDDVLCYTYGVACNPQRAIAEQVAKALGFEWRFIEYNGERWAECMSNPEMSGYWDYAFRGVSSPHLQDFPAVLELASGFEPGDRPIFLPGHVGDAWAWRIAMHRLDDKYSYPPSEYHSRYRSIRGSSVVSAIVHRHLNLWPVTSRMWATEPWSSLAQKIEDEVRGYENPRASDIWRFMEWVLRSRTALWIVNSCRCFEYFGTSFVLPLGTNELIDFFRKLPMEHLLNGGLYATTLKNRILGEHNRLLRDIPVWSGAAGSARTHTLKHMVARVLSAMGLFMPLDGLRRRYRKPQSLYAESWFAQGGRPERTSIRDGLRPFEIEQNLPAEIREVVGQFLCRPLYSIQCNGLLTTVVLSKEYARRRV